MVEYQLYTLRAGQVPSRARIRKRWDAAHQLFRTMVFDATEAQALRDRPAGWEAHHAALAVTKPALHERSRTVTIGQVTVCVEAVR